MTKLPTWFEENVPAEIAESEVFRFTVAFPSGKTAKFDLTQGIDIDYEMLEQHLEQTPAQFMYWGAMYSELRSKVTIIELQIKARRRAVANAIIEQFRNNQVRLTDKQFEKLLDGDERITKLEAELAATQKRVGKVLYMVEAIRMRSEHCRSLAGFKRQDKEQSSRTP